MDKGSPEEKQSKGRREHSATEKQSKETQEQGPCVLREQSCPALGHTTESLVCLSHETLSPRGSGSAGPEQPQHSSPLHCHLPLPPHSPGAGIFTHS